MSYILLSLNFQVHAYAERKFGKLFEVNCILGRNTVWLTAKVNTQTCGVNQVSFCGKSCRDVQLSCISLTLVFPTRLSSLG